ncbi:uncharacterized protein LOC129216498 [Uloborus diversus]|uniref:uncharacterized protein LOC129216498 n=1 Tax=Uloborus diversus TaxID=327109 RepID=UPI00240A56B6|nr:uncharacterized protein LOC129216498 [Uloborus diversus]
MEAIGIKDPFEQKSKSEIDKAVNDHFIANLRKDDEGRYEVKLPWVHDKNLPEYRDIAEKRLERTTTKLKLEGKYDAYNMVLKEWLNDDIIEKVPLEELPKSGCYLPHRGIFKENSTTKIRPVCDASNRRKGFPSLNDYLEKGPNTLELIPSLLVRFREKRIGIISDIKKAFLQIGINVEDRDYLRFLWWKDSESKTIQVLRHRRLVFDLTSSPFILGSVIRHHLENSCIEHKEIAEMLLKSFYVDNCVTSLDTESEAQHFKEVSTQLMASVKFELRGWELTDFNVSTSE